jgi:ATP-dependent protease ClpP protease subunit
MEQLKAAKDPVTVRIHSPGGSVFDGMAIYTMLRQRGVTVQVDGLAASAASLIAMAGTTIRMGQGAMMMAHRAWTVAMGDGDSMRHAAGILDGIDASITSIYAARLKKPVEEMAKMLAGEVWLTAEQAKADGWADEIFNGPAPRAQLKLSGLANVPAAAMAAWGGVPTKPEAPMGIAARLLALVGVKPAEGETDEQTIGRLDALTAALGEGPEARAAFLANETAPQVFARLRQELTDAQAKIVAGAAALAEAQKLASEASALKAALTAEQAKVAALAPGLATNAPAAAASNANSGAPTAAEYHAELARVIATGKTKNEALALIASTRPDLVAALSKSATK